MAEESRLEAAENKPKNFQQWIEYVNYDWERDSAGELRNALLVVAVLFITVAFQAGINLPSHIFPQDSGSTGSPYTQAMFLAANTILLSASMHIISYVTISLPFRKEILGAAGFLMGTYGCSLGATSLPASLKFPILFIPYVILALRWLPRFASSKQRINASSQPNQSQ